MMGNQVGSALNLHLFNVPKAHAQNSIAGGLANLLKKATTPPHAELGIVAILVENSLLDDKAKYKTDTANFTLREHVFSYAENVQKRLPHTRAIIIGVDPNESTQKISTVLEKLYYEGADNDMLDSSKINDDGKKEDDNQLKGVVLVGDIPTPVVYDKDGETAPSLYPYTDFYRKRYIFNHSNQHFELNENALKPSPEVWHGVIRPPSKNNSTRRQQLADYFDKNNQYSNNQGGYNDFSKRMLYYNFPAVEKKLNTLDYRNYKRGMKYAEEFAFRRYTKNLIKTIVDEVAEEMEPDKDPKDRNPLIDEQSISNMIGTGVELVIKKFSKNFASSLQTYLGRLNAKIAGTGRWSEKEFDTLASLITIRDEYMKTMLMGKSIELEKLINAEVDKVQETINVISTVKLEMEETFNLLSYIDGKRVSDTDFVTAGQCGLQRGQTRPKGTPILENNSVRVEANRTFNPDTGIIPPEGDTTKLIEKQEYQKYGGCVANNSVKIDQDSAGIHLGPEHCDPKAAVNPVYDIAGSFELGFSFFNPKDPKPSQSLVLENEQCELEDLSFLGTSIPNFGLYSDDGLFKQKAYCNSSIPLACAAPLGIAPDTYLDEAVNDWFKYLVNAGSLKLDLTKKEDAALANYSNNIAHLRLNRILQLFLKSGLSHSTSFKDGSSDTIGVKITATTKPIKTMVRHVEPTDLTINHTCSTQVTRAIPSDGIRYVEFYKGSQRRSYAYPNLFRIQGNNPKEITDNLLALVKQKDAELNALLGSNKNTVGNFFLNNAELTEPILWRQLGIDQKHQLVLEKYLNKNSFMPVPDPTALAPVTKPEGYEVLHVNAEGDEKGFEFAINRSRLSEKDLKDPEIDAAKKALKDAQKKAGGDGSADGTGSGQQTKLFGCGGNDGVEIWEWLPNVIGCWIPEEILKLSDLVSLDDSHSKPLPPPEPKPEDAIFDALEDPALAANNPENQPASIEVTVDKKTLVRGEKTPINVKVLNKKGKRVVGYIPDPLTFTADESLVSFDKTSRSVFTGTDRGVMTALTKSGKANLKVGLGSLSKTIPVNIVDGIKVKLTYERETGKPSYKVTANLVDLSGKPVTNVSTKIKAAALNPADGKFAPSLITLENGKGEAKFFPNPAGIDIRIKAQHPIYTSEIVQVPAIINDPFKVVINAPKDLPVGETIKVPIAVTDIFGVVSKDFSETVTVKVTKKFQKYGMVDFDPVQITAGKGLMTVRVGKDTGQLNVIASHSKLAPGTAEMPIAARVTEEEWSKTFPQNLFASFVGFPAGDFMKEGYFGGTHLFQGKTQAVFSFIEPPKRAAKLTINPNYKMIPVSTGQVFTVENLTDQISLQVVDKKSLKSIMGAILPLDFSSVDTWTDSRSAKEGVIYFGLVDDSYSAQKTGQALELFNREGDKIMTLEPSKLRFHDISTRITYDDESSQSMMELIVQDEFLNEIGRLYLNYKPRKLSEKDFIINPDLKFRKLFTGNNVTDPSGLALYDPEVEIEDEKKLTEHFGFETDSKYIHRFGGGSPIGEAVMWNLPYNAVLLGDPTIRLSNSSASSLNYDNTIGRQIYQDAEESDIVALTNFDYNNDGIEDVATVLKDGRIRLMEGGHTDPIYRDRGDIAFLSDGVLTVTSFDFKNDGYDDLLVATQEGRLAILHNDREVITRTNQQLKVGKQLYQLSKADMDADGLDDLVTLDSRGDIRIFYNKNNQIPENGQLIGNYGFSIKTKTNLKNDLKLRYPNIPEPQSVPQSSNNGPPIGPTTGPPIGSQSASNVFGLTLPTQPPFDTSKLAGFATKDTSKDVSQSAAKAFVDTQRKAAQNKVETGANSPKLPWKEGEESESYFAPLSDFEINNSAFHGGQYFTTVKTVSNKDRPGATDLDLQEKLTYQIELTASKNVSKFVLADTIPDSLTLDEKSVKCEGSGCEGMDVKPNDIYLFISNLNLKAGKKITVTYDVTVKRTPKAAVMIKKLDAKTKVNAPVPLDGFKDILVSPPYNNTGQLVAHYTVAPRTYRVASTQKDEDPGVSAAVKKHLEGIAELNKLSSLKATDKVDPKVLQNMMKKTGLDKVQSDLKECKIDPSGAPPVPTPEECAKDPKKCASNVLNDIGNAISNFSCMGGGCFPMPFNMAFLAPKTIPFAMPLLAFPATLITPIGPLPVPSFFGVAPTPLGAAEIPGPIMSMIRLYTIPTLTGGMSIAMCWGPFPPGSPVPPPLIPIPYPPPIGNCMTFAIPMSELPHCKVIEKGITALLEAANSVISDANSGIAAVNNSGLPVELEQADKAQGGAAGGLEVGLAVNLGKSMKFEPPTKSFSNTHLGSYDSIGGKIGSWLDKQMLEIFNKLLTLPQLRVILPDIPAMFSSDWTEFNKLTTTWWNNVTGVDKKAVAAGKGIADVASNLVGQDVDKSKGFIDSYKTVENEIKGFNTTAIEDLYAIVNNIPYINLNEQFVDLKIPYISYAQLQDVKRDFEGAKLYYTKQVNKYRELIQKYRCPDPKLNTKECIISKVLNILVVDIDTFIKSIDKNIQVLQSYMKFPRDVVLMYRQVAQYLSQTAAILENFSNMLGGWLLTIQEQIIGYAEVYYTIIEIVNNIKKLFNIFTNFEDNCDICTNDRLGNFGWYMLLGLVIPEIPIIKFPKWPDLVIDLSDLKAEVNLELPIINFIGQPIKLPRIPLIPFPDLPDLTDIQLGLQIPPLPVLPSLPELPQLPPLPAVPTIKLPTLPAPPKLPDIAKDFEAIIQIIELLLQIWCMIKKSFSPVPEGYLGDHAVLLTNRPAYLTPLDMLQIKIGDITGPDIGFDELRIETKVYLGLRLKEVSESLNEAAKEWNENIPTDWSDLFSKALAAFLEGYGIDFDDPFAALEELTDKISKGIEEGISAVEKGWEDSVQKGFDQLGQELEEFDQKYFRTAENDLQELSDEATKIMGKGTEKANQLMVNTMRDYRDWATKIDKKTARIFSEAGASSVAQWINTGLTGFPPMDLIKDVDVNDWIQESIFVGISRAYSQIITRGTSNINDLIKSAKAASGDKTPEWINNIIKALEKAKELMEDEGKTFDEAYKDSRVRAILKSKPQAQKTPVTREHASIPPEVKDQLLARFKELSGKVNSINKSEPVDYTVLKEKYNVPDYKLPDSTTAVDKIEAMRNKVLESSQKYNEMAIEDVSTDDLYAFVQGLAKPTSAEPMIEIKSIQPEQLSQAPAPSPAPRSSPSKYVAQANTGGTQTTISKSGAAQVCVGTCLVDPQTNLSVQFIPSFDNPATSKTAFIPTRFPGKSNVVYSDGPSLYLKRDLSVPLNITSNIPPRVPNIIFDLNHFSGVPQRSHNGPTTERD